MWLPCRNCATSWVRSRSPPRRPSSGCPLMTATSEIANELQMALTLHQQGRLAQAEAVYQGILNRDPNPFDAQCLPGVIASQRKNFAAPILLLNRALKLNPN